MFIAIFTIARKGKQPKYPSADKWILQMRHIDMTECYSAVKFQTLKVAGKWMGLEKIILRELPETQKDKCCMFSPILVPSSRSSDGSIQLGESKRDHGSGGVGKQRRGK